jgi:SAM-dependent methyltransferase
MRQISDAEKAALIERYAGRYSVPFCSYGTVEDYCDSCDHLPWLSSVQNDLKDLQRPWTIKATLDLLPPPARLLEIGAGEPLVAAYLVQLGYEVTVVDPYDGSGGGPQDFELFMQTYPEVRIIRAPFQAGLPELSGVTFDGIYSISVLEHIPKAGLANLFEGLSRHLRIGGYSFHSVDCVSEGVGAQHHFQQCLIIVSHQCAIAGRPPLQKDDLSALLRRADHDLETCYLSAAGHNLWRAGANYEAFPFRKVLSIQFAAKTQTKVVV